MALVCGMDAAAAIRMDGARAKERDREMRELAFSKHARATYNYNLYYKHACIFL
jgi:hypothetical protein